MLSLAERLKIVPQIGTVSWLGVRPGRGEPMIERTEVEAIADRGIAGDRYRASGTRQVTLIQAEHVPVIAALVGRGEIRPDQLRRNVVVRGINLVSLQKQRFAIGEAILVGTSTCAPCDKMEVAIGEGAFQAMRGHGGICAKIERSGAIRIGDRVRLLG
ncbi:MAG: MOSC domain-containing protein [Kofleriaceae bacterium]